MVTYPPVYVKQNGKVFTAVWGDLVISANTPAEVFRLLAEELGALAEEWPDIF